MVDSHGTTETTVLSYLIKINYVLITVIYGHAMTSRLNLFFQVIYQKMSGTTSRVAIVEMVRTKFGDNHFDKMVGQLA